MKRLALTPARAVILAIDAGAVSGHALTAPENGKHALLDSGYCGDADERSQVCEDAWLSADARDLPLVVVAEDWPSGAFPNATAYGSVRESWGAWRQALEAALGDEPLRLVRVHVGTWRGALGLRPVVDATVRAKPERDRSRAAWKRSAVLAVSARFGMMCSDDEAEAICIATWGAHSAEVAAVLAPKTRRRAA